MITAHLQTITLAADASKSSKRLRTNAVLPGMPPLKTFMATRLLTNVGKVDKKLLRQTIAAKLSRDGPS
jgi:hypothetical protein